MRTFCVGFLALIGLTASASYDLLLVTDSVNNQIRRYDGSTGASLGSIGVGRMNSPTGIAIDKNSGLVYVSHFNTNSISVWNYSTGVFVNEFSVAGGVRGICVSNAGTIFAACGSSIQIYSTSGQSLGSFGSATMFTEVQQQPNGTIFATVRDSSGVFRMSNYTASFALAGTSAANTYATWFPFQSVVVGNSLLVAAGDTIGPVGQLSIYSTASTPVLQSNKVTSEYARIEGIANGHGNMFYITGALTSDTTKSAISPARYLNGTLTVFPSFGAFSGTSVSMASVIAPEPGPFIVLGLGVCALLKRRASAR